MPIDNNLLNLLVTGQTSDHKDSLDPDKAIQIISNVVECDPKSFIETIKEVFEVRIDGMMMIALAVFIAKADRDFLKKNELLLFEMLDEYGPPKLLQLVELLKSKILGKGFGSRPQKIIRTTMEGWSFKKLKYYSTKHHKPLYSLIMLVHPRYNAARGKLIKKFLNNGSDQDVKSYQ